MENIIENLIEEIKTSQQINLAEFLMSMENAFKISGFREKKIDGEQQNILVIRLDAIGDNVLNSGFLRELRRNYPSAHITLIVNTTVYNIVELCPYVNEVLKFACNPNLILWLNEAIKICREKLWHRHFDICFIPRWDIGVSNENLLGFISGANQRISYGSQVHPGKAKIILHDILLTNKILNPPEIIHETARNLYILKALGLTVQDTKNELWYSHEDILNANKLLNDAIPDGGAERHLISICNGASAGGKSKIYPPELFAQALKLIADKSDCSFVYFGSKEFFSFGEFLQHSLGNRLINLAGKTTLREMCAVMSKTSIYIGGDTGTMHIAAALKLPIIMIFKDAKDCPKDYRSTALRFTPWQTPTIIVQPEHALKPCCDKVPVAECFANEPHCITQITPQNIADAFDVMKKIIYNSN